MDELLAFLSAGIEDFRTTASVLPSSKSVIEAMTRPLPLERARCVVELGAGTGVVTEALLAAMPSEARLLSFEINPKLAEYVRARLPDPRLAVVTRSAEFLREELRERGLGPADAVASSLPLTFMDDALRHRVYAEAAGSLRRGGVLSQYVYMHGRYVPFRKFDDEFQAFPAETFFGGLFSKVSRRQVWKNVPPAFVYACER